MTTATTSMTQEEALEALRMDDPKHHLASCPGAYYTPQGRSWGRIDCPHDVGWDYFD